VKNFSIAVDGSIVEAKMSLPVRVAPGTETGVSAMLPMLPVTMIIVDVVDGFTVVTIRLTDGEYRQTIVVSNHEWRIMAATLQPHEWDALALALREPGRWVAV